MIDDIVFDENNLFILELPEGEAGGNIISFSFDGANYDIKSMETSVVFIS